ncbi:cuticle protein 21.3-like [Nylanderia fulva]|uniref:cuticle protein 21.3-like n=1 Tax=Nylanderia fulva TaxID=613905 RepID=UPI0010FB452F|nr:cuticle protein 21.3-like [Nylanderia fulva]
MAFKFVILAVFVAVANAGGPAAYDIGTVSADLSSIGYSQESTQKGYGGQNVVSSYSRAEDSAHSSVRVSNSRVSNDLLEHHIGYAAAPLIAKTYAAPALAKPLIAAPQPLIAAPQPLIAAQHSLLAAPQPLIAAPQPLIAKTAYAAPALAAYSAHPAPILAKASYAYAPAASYASPLLTKAYATPFIAKAPVAAPLIAKTYAHGLAPTLAYASHPAPVLAKTYAAPYAYEAHAAPVVHAAFTGFGTSYAW